MKSAEKQRNSSNMPIKLSSIKANTANPRLIKDSRFKKLVQSIQEFPKMMELRPLVIDDNRVIIGGNMRFRALKFLDYTEVPDKWVKKASDLTDEERSRFIVADNVGFGESDWNELATNWKTDDLEHWGLEVPEFGKMDLEPTGSTISFQKSNLPVIKITFKTVAQMQRAEAEIKAIVEKFEGSSYSTSAV